MLSTRSTMPSINFTTWWCEQWPHKSPTHPRQEHRSGTSPRALWHRSSSRISAMCCHFVVERKVEDGPGLRLRANLALKSKTYLMAANARLRSEPKTDWWQEGETHTIQDDKCTAEDEPNASKKTQPRDGQKSPLAVCVSHLWIGSRLGPLIRPQWKGRPSRPTEHVAQ